MKILILMTYFNRPLLVKNALNSILKASCLYDNWHLIFGDDNSPVPGEPIVIDILKDHINKVSFINSNMTFQDKVEKGLAFGKYANQIVANTDADVAIFLCDDDELHHAYLYNLATFMACKPQVMYCYSKVHIYNPLVQSSEGIDNVTGKFNAWDTPINPANNLDVSQVAFRLDCCRVHGVKFPESTVGKDPWTENIDGGFFQALYDKFGPAEPTHFVSQYKGIHDYQLVWHKKQGVEGLEKYMNDIIELGGKRF